MNMLRTARKAKGLTMKELGEKVGVSESAISQYENGKREADYNTILKISEILDCPVDYLLRGEDSKNHTNRIAELRKERNLSQQELAIIIGVTPNAVCSWENENQKPDFDSLRKMAFFFHCSIEYLLGTAPFGYHFVFDEQTDPNLDWAGRPLAGEGKEKKSAPKVEDGLSEIAKRFLPLVDELTPAQQDLLLVQLQAWTEQNKQQALVAQQSDEERVPKSDL